VLQYPLASKQLWLQSIVVAKRQRQHHEFGQYLGEQGFMVDMATVGKPTQHPKLIST